VPLIDYIDIKILICNLHGVVIGLFGEIYERMVRFSTAKKANSKMSLVLWMMLALVQLVQSLPYLDVTELPYVQRQSGFQNVVFANSVVGTTQFLVLTASHGNPPAGQIRFASVTQGGGWSLVVYGGDDDKSAEIYRRVVTNSNKDDLGAIDTKSAAGSLCMVVFSGIVNVGNVNGRRISDEAVSLNTPGSGDFLVVFGSDSGGSSTQADVVVKPGTDDTSFFYLRTSGDFRDTTLGTRRGGIAAVELTNTLAPTTRAPTTRSPTTRSPTTRSPTRDPTNTPTNVVTITPSTSPIANPDLDPAPSENVDTAFIAGSAGGGAILLSVMALFMWRVRNSRKRQSRATTTREPRPNPARQQPSFMPQQSYAGQQQQLWTSSQNPTYNYNYA
jgi:hypothetical protein